MGGNRVRRAPPPPPPVRRSPRDENLLYESDAATDTEDDMDNLVPEIHERNKSNDGGRDFENFRVTIKNAHNRRQLISDKHKQKGRGKSLDGTPSLSGIDDEEVDDEDEDSYYDDTHDEDTEDEESRQRRQRHRRGGGGEEFIDDENLSPSLPEPIVRRKGNIKDRLGSRIPVRPPSPPDPPPKRHRIAPPLTPPNKKPLGSSRSADMKAGQRPPSPMSTPPNEQNVINESDDDAEIENQRRNKIKAYEKRDRGTHQTSSRNPNSQRSQGNTHKRVRSPRRPRSGNKRNARSWSKGNDQLGSRYGNRSPTPLPGTPRRVKEQRAREAAAKKEKNKNRGRDERKRNNPIYGKSKMRMDSESKLKKGRDRSNDSAEEIKERPSSRTEKLRDQRSNKGVKDKSDLHRSSSKKDKHNDRNRSRTSSGGFGKGVIGKNRGRNTSGGNRPPTPVPIGSKSRSRNSRKTKDKPQRKSFDSKERPEKTKSQNSDKTSKENEMMLRRLARKRKGIPHSTESDKNHTLAKIAGIEIPVGTSGLESPKETSVKNERERSVTGSELSEPYSRNSVFSNRDNDSCSRSASGSPTRGDRKRDWKSGAQDKSSSSKKRSTTDASKHKKRNVKERKSNRDRKSDNEKDKDRSHSRSRSKEVRSYLFHILYRHLGQNFSRY